MWKLMLTEHIERILLALLLNKLTQTLCQPQKPGNNKPTLNPIAKEMVN